MKNPIQMPSKPELSNLRTTTKAAVTPTASADAIAERAYAKYLARGAKDGHDREDWLAAEQEIVVEARASSRVPRN